MRFPNSIKTLAPIFVCEGFIGSANAHALRLCAQARDALLRVRMGLKQALEGDVSARQRVDDAHMRGGGRRLRERRAVPCIIFDLLER